MGSNFLTTLLAGVLCGKVLLGTPMFLLFCWCMKQQRARYEKRFAAREEEHRCELQATKAAASGNPAFLEDEFFALPLHPAWDDGRTGFLFARVTAILSDAPAFINAEVVWAAAEVMWKDKSGQLIVDRTATLYFDPILTIETNRIEGGARCTFDTYDIQLTVPAALDLMTGDPQRILTMYPNEIAKLAVPT